MNNEQKYSIGTSVRFVYKNADEGKPGKIVGIETHPYGIDKVRYFVFIPTSSSPFSGRTRDNIEYTWRCSLSQIELLSIPNEQLLFEFMY